MFRFRGDGPLEAKDRVDATDACEEGGSVHDQGRIDSMRTHIKVMRDTVELDGVDLVGYAPWGLDRRRSFVPGYSCFVRPAVLKRVRSEPGDRLVDRRLAVRHLVRRDAILNRDLI